MNRKDFLSVAIPAGITLTSIESFGNGVAGVSDKKTPAYLQIGDTIGITSPAGFITLEDIAPSVALMESWGFKILIGSTIGKRDFTFGGTDAERLEDFQQMLNNPGIKAIMCARGGYGVVRIIDQLDFSFFKKQPKWIIGFSDITVLHSHINRNFKIPTIHSKMCNSFPKDCALAELIQIETILSIKKALMGETMTYSAISTPNNKHGKVVGKLVGGNLRTIENLSGTSSQLVTRNKILFVEDTGEYLYSIDRMFWNLKRTGMLENLGGLIVGGFKVKPEDIGEEFGKNIYDVVLEKVKAYNYPVCFDFPVGHQKNNYALKCGIEHLLDVNEYGTTLISI